MPIKVNIKTHIRVNGVEYNSPEEMPSDVRKVYDKAMQTAGTQSVGGSSAPATGTKIVFNDKVYTQAEDLPPEIRQVVENVMHGPDQNHNGVPDVLEGAPLAVQPGIPAPQNYPQEVPTPASTNSAITPVSSFSPVWIILAVLVLLLLAGGYLIASSLLAH